jgi:hypothetical protein
MHIDEGTESTGTTIRGDTTVDAGITGAAIPDAVETAATAPWAPAATWAAATGSSPTDADELPACGLAISGNIFSFLAVEGGLVASGIVWS